MQYKKELRQLTKQRNKLRIIKSDNRELKKGLTKGKPQKKKGKSNSENNHNKPRGWTRLNKSFTNSLAKLGLTDQETKEYIKTGNIPARFKKDEN